MCHEPWYDQAMNRSYQHPSATEIAIGPRGWFMYHSPKRTDPMVTELPPSVLLGEWLGTRLLFDSPEHRFSDWEGANPIYQQLTAILYAETAWRGG